MTPNTRLNWDIIALRISRITKMMDRIEVWIFSNIGTAGTRLIWWISACMTWWITLKTIIKIIVIPLRTIFWTNSKIWIVIRIHTSIWTSQTWITTIILTSQAWLITLQTIIIAFIITITTLQRTCLQFLIVMRIWTIYQTTQAWLVRWICACITWWITL